MKGLCPGTRVAFAYQQYAKASWFGTGTVVAWDPLCNMYTVDRDPNVDSPALATEIARARERWPEHHVRRARFQPREQSEDLVLPAVRPEEVRYLTQLGYRQGMHFDVPASRWRVGRTGS